MTFDATRLFAPRISSAESEFLPASSGGDFSLMMSL